MRHLILLPDLGQTTNEAKVLQWRKKPGEFIARGEPLLEVETDKVDMDVESFVKGYLRETLVGEGDIATALSPVAVITDTQDEEYAPPGEDSAEAVEPVDSGAPLGASEQAAPAAPSPRGKVAAAPAARKRALELGVDLSAVRGTGPGGLVTRRDVEECTLSTSASVVAPAEGKTRSLGAMAALVAESKKDIPHFYVRRDFVVDRADSWRKQWNERHPDLKVTWNEIFVRAASAALRDVPELNTSLVGGSLRSHTEPEVLIVVASEGKLSLVPVRAPSAGDWEDFLRDVKSRVSKGGRSISAAEAAMGTPRLAVSNLGMHGVKEFSAIIPPGSSAILAVGAVQWEPVVREGNVVPAQVCRLTLSADHRIVDGIVAARFLESVERFLNTLEL